MITKYKLRIRFRFEIHDMVRNSENSRKNYKCDYLTTSDISDRKISATVLNTVILCSEYLLVYEISDEYNPWNRTKYYYNCQTINKSANLLYFEKLYKSPVSVIVVKAWNLKSEFCYLLSVICYLIGLWCDRVWNLKSENLLSVIW